MNRIASRTRFVLAFIAILLGGLLFFLVEYATQAEQWVVTPGSPHLYAGGHLNSGSVRDREGNLLLDLSHGRTYSDNVTTRKSTLHWVGDRAGYIPDPLVEKYSAAMSGFDLVNGLYGAADQPGTMTLTLSARVQNKALSALGGRKGTVGVYNYKTGEILCAVTSPNFDPENVPKISEDEKGTYEGVYLNRFTQSSYPPGSIFKVVTTAAALDTVPDILDKTFTCTGKYEYGIDRVTCEGVHGQVDLKSALARSCNCAFAQIAELVGRDTMEKYVKKFGLLEPVTFDGITTARGHYDISDAADVEFAWSCIGQYTDLVNPARYMTFMGAIAGGGVGAEPHIVASVGSEKKTVYEASTTRGSRIMSQELAATMQEYMHNNVQKVYGTWNFPGFETVCGKSGTSQLGGGQMSNAMFAGFIMDENYPLAFMAVVENAGYGSANCVPILSKVLAECKNVMDSQ